MLCQRILPRFILLWLSGLILSFASAGVESRSDTTEGAGLPPTAQIKVDFRRDIEPLFREKCQVCHGTAQQANGLRLDTRAAALVGGYSGPVIKPGNSTESRLIRLVAGLEKDRIMPLGGERLTAEQVGLLRAWIDQGADWPDVVSEQPTVAVSSDKVAAKLRHWAFITPQRPEIPKVRNQAWVRNPIDAFILAKLEAAGIEPSPEAERITLIRRLSLDLIGLPPTSEEVAQFDNRADAYERLVDLLLASPHYGEKWARPWLDLAHYADSDGCEMDTDTPRPHAWRYRQWVIEALNRNMPFDEFTLEQLAGDLLPNATVEQKVAAGFYRHTLTNREGGMDLEERRVGQVIDRTDTFGTVWLGLTLGCAKCHDHKYDPISQKEYYQLFAFFNSANEVNIEAPLPGEMGPYLRTKPEYDRKRRELLAQYNVPELQSEWEQETLDAATNPEASYTWKRAWHMVGTLVDGGQNILRLPPSQRTQKQQDQLTDHFVAWYGLVANGKKYEEVKFKELGKKLRDLAEQHPSLSEAQTMVENPYPPKTHLLVRGNFSQPGIEVEPNTPGVLPSLPPDSKPTRLTLARWVVSRDNPLTARVAVNRMWQEFFGRGLVASSENFGSRSDPPTHPELLDWLTTEFMQNNWNVKRMHKLMVTSATYRQSSKTRKEDPDNKLLARQLRLRLSAELVRDASLATSGLLNPAIGGKSVQPSLPASVLSEPAFRLHPWKESQGAERYRRGLYIFFKRTLPYPQLVTFDAPDSLSACSRRERSNNPLQALVMLNEPVFFRGGPGVGSPDSARVAN